MGLFSSRSSTSQTSNVNDESIRLNNNGDISTSGAPVFFGVRGGTFNTTDFGSIKGALALSAAAIDSDSDLSDRLISTTTGDSGAAKNSALLIVAVGLAIAGIAYVGK